MISPTRRSYHLPEISLLSALLEIGVILVLVMNFTAIVRDPSGTQRIRGGEYSYLVSSGAVASVIFHKTGAIPLWNPFIGSGEPLFENPFSFILNPLMAWPILLQGPVDGGKTAVMLHVLLLALGGWVLARVLRLGWAPRVMLGLLFGGSGSVAGAIGMGFYQMGLSQVYVPWVLAGLIGTLYIPRRWPIALLAVSTMLLVFAGTFWYALTTAIVALLIAAFAVFWWDSDARRIQVDRWMVKRLLLTGVVIVGICAIRVLPQVATSGLVDHPREGLANSYDFSTMMTFYFSTVIASYDTHLGITAIYYHYILPPLFALVLVFLQLTLLPIRRFQRLGDWRIIIPGALAILFFTAWSQEGTIGVRWLYDNVPFLEQWRFVGRVMAAASPWVAIIAVIWLDNIIFQLVAHIKTLNSRNIGTVFIPQAALIVLLLVSLFSSLDVLGNWRRVAGTDSVDTVEDQPVHYLRAQNPAKFLSVKTSSFFVYLPFYDSLTRAAFGNPDYHAKGLPSTIGRVSAMSFDSEYAVGIDTGFVNAIEQTGYQLIRGKDPRIKIDPTKAYLASAWVKTDNVDQNGAQIWVDQYDRAGNIVTTAYSQSITGTQDWQQLQLNVTPNPATNSVGIRLHLNGSGTVWFDDASFALNPNGSPPVYVPGPNARQPANPQSNGQGAPAGGGSPQAAATPYNVAPQSQGSTSSPANGTNSANNGTTGTNASTPVNLIANGDFEEKPVDANGWSTEGNGTYLWADDEIHSGLHSVKISGLNVNGSFTDIPHSVNAAAIWQNLSVPTYAFSVPVDTLQFRDERPLTQQEITPVETYTHNIDNIHLSVGDHDPGSVLVVQETAFPGWNVTVNGKPAQIESVGGLIGVRLPDAATSADPTSVVFTYHPSLLYASALISLLALLFLIAFMLRLDRFVPLRVKRQATTLAERAETMITERRSSRYGELAITPIRVVPDRLPEKVPDEPLLVERLDTMGDNNHPGDDGLEP